MLVEQMTGIEPAYSAWEADTLPLSYICKCYSPIIHQNFPSVKRKQDIFLKMSCFFENSIYFLGVVIPVPFVMPVPLMMASADALMTTTVTIVAMMMTSAVIAPTKAPFPQLFARIGM